jgi:hypothetical protein
VASRDSNPLTPHEWIEVKFTVDTLRRRYVLVMFGLVTAYYCLASLSIARMPFASTPSWWMAIWPSRKFGVYAWFGLLNAVGAVIAAVPVSVLLRWLIDGNRIRAAFIVGAPTAFLMPLLAIRAELLAEWALDDSLWEA